MGSSRPARTTVRCSSRRRAPASEPSACIRESGSMADAGAPKRPDLPPTLLRRVEPSTPFPVLAETSSDEHSPWPAPPFAWRHAHLAGSGAPQACRIESHGGTVLDGEMLAF